jgi:hypothetical protein
MVDCVNNVAHKVNVVCSKQPKGLRKTNRA